MIAMGIRSVAGRAALAVALACAPITLGAETARVADTTGVQSNQRTIVIGFLGGYVSRNSSTRSEVKMAHRLRAEYSDVARIETFENRRMDVAYREILKFIVGKDGGKPSDEQKRHARVV